MISKLYNERFLYNGVLYDFTKTEMELAFKWVKLQKEIEIGTAPDEFYSDDIGDMTIVIDVAKGVHKERGVSVDSTIKEWACSLKDYIANSVYIKVG